MVPEALTLRPAPSESASQHCLLHLTPFGPGVDGGGPDLGSGLMPGALVTHLNGERIYLLTTSVYNRIVDPDPLDPDPPDTNPTDMSVCLLYTSPSPRDS